VENNKERTLQEQKQRERTLNCKKDDREERKVEKILLKKYTKKRM